jgi:hypothetical protein
VASPLFHTASEEIARKLGLANLKSAEQEGDQFAAAVEFARTKMWSLLGKGRVDVLVALVPATGAPSTNDEYLRAIAEQVEEDLVRYELAGVIPIGFSGGEVDFSVANRADDSSFRELDPDKIEQIRNIWWNDPHSGIASKLSYLLDGAPTTAVVSRVAIRESGQNGQPARVVFPPNAFFGPTLNTLSEIAAAYTQLLVDF